MKSPALLIATLFTLAGCISPGEYDHLILEIEQHLEAGQFSYAENSARKTNSGNVRFHSQGLGETTKTPKVMPREEFVDLLESIASTASLGCGSESNSKEKAICTVDRYNKKRIKIATIKHPFRVDLVAAFDKVWVKDLEEAQREVRYRAEFEERVRRDQEERDHREALDRDPMVIEMRKKEAEEKRKIGERVGVILKKFDDLKCIVLSGAKVTQRIAPRTYVVQLSQLQDRQVIILNMKKDVFKQPAAIFREMDLYGRFSSMTTATTASGFEEKMEVYAESDECKALMQQARALNG
jgi:hypothetical protein